VTAKKGKVDNEGTSTIDVAKAKLASYQFKLADLPRNISDPLWNDMRREYKLTIPEISVLKTYVASTSCDSLLHAVYFTRYVSFDHCGALRFLFECLFCAA
jgi:hypothetical protein